MGDVIDPDVVHQYEHETWTRCAATYLDHFAGLTRETIPLLRDAANIRSDRTVLDLGSGPGHVAGALAEHGADVTGIDFSARMVEVARRSHPKATFLEANAEQLPFDDTSFEAVVSNFVVHHLARPDVVFREVCRVLEPGGCFAFVVFERPEAQSSIGAFFEAVAAHHDSDELPHGPLFGAERSAYVAPLKASGLGEAHFETHDILWRSETIDPVLQAFLEWGNIAALPRDVQQKIEVTARENLESYRDGGGYAFPHAVLLGAAVRPG
ncbi:MAG: class I SAM-dependent methyltransferase [Planctomycetota bacterium]|jgi:ubiquinone/menaquinone biosynthesis C-methylase UbiE